MAAKESARVLSTCAERSGAKNRESSKMPVNAQEEKRGDPARLAVQDAGDDNSSTGVDFIRITNKFTVINAFQFEILKFNNFQA